VYEYVRGRIHIQIYMFTHTHSHSFPSNGIKNTKYTWLNFLPKNFMEQFSLHINRYFLFIACLQLITVCMCVCVCVCVNVYVYVSESFSLYDVSHTT
jgi:hypothetical protein